MPASDASALPPPRLRPVARPRRHAPRAGIAAAAIVASMLAACSGDAVRDDSVSPLPATHDRGATWTEAQVNTEGRIRVLYVPAPGFAYRDAEGTLTGVTVEIMRDFVRHVAERHGVDLELEFVEETGWSVFYERVRDASGGVFGLGNVTITDARRSELRFSPSYMTNVAVLITHAIVPELESLDEIPATFQGLRPLAFAGTLHEERLRALRDAYLPDAEIVTAASNTEIIERSASAPDYFAYVDIYNFWRALEAGEPLRQHPPGDAPGEEFGIIMPLSSDWQEIVDEYFTAGGGLRRRDFYRRLLTAHLGAGLAEQLRAAPPAER